MPTLCPHCNAPASPSAVDCAYCGGALRPGAAYAYAAPEPVRVWSDAPEIALHPMSVTKLVVMSLVSFGLYHIWWHYRNWKLRNDLRGRGVTPALRAIFSPLFAYSLFEDVEEEVRRWGMGVGWNAVFLGIMYFLSNAATRLPEPFWIAGLAAVFILVPVQRSINAANAASSRPAPVNDRFSAANIAGIVLGGILLFLALIGTFFPA